MREDHKKRLVGGENYYWFAVGNYLSIPFVLLGLALLGVALDRRRLGGGSNDVGRGVVK